MPFSDRRFLTATVLLLCVSCSNDNSSTPTTPAPSCTVSAGAITASAFGAAGGSGGARHGASGARGRRRAARLSSRFNSLRRGGTVAFTVAVSRRAGPRSPSRASR